jgi:hypothetical protein
MKTVYKLYDDDGVCLYVACSLHALSRIAQHHRKHWFRKVVSMTCEHFTDHDLARRVECAAIKRERPKHNTYMGVRVVRGRDGKYTEQRV